MSFSQQPVQGNSGPAQWDREVITLATSANSRLPGAVQVRLQTCAFFGRSQDVTN